MSIAYQVREEDGYLFYVAKGQPKDEEELVEYLRSVYHEAHKRGFSYGLVDETEVLLDFNVYDPVIVTDAIDSMALSQLGVSFAVVAPRYCAQLYEHFASMLRERSLSVIIFEDVETAKDWMVKKLASQQAQQ